MPLDTALLFLSASLALAAAPGPDNLFVLTQSALHGRLAGVCVIAGLFTGVLVHTAGVALGVAAVLAASSVAFTVLKLAGAAYLLYLAWQAWRAPSPAGGSSASPELSAGALFRRGLVMNVANPKVAIFFLAFLPQFVDPSRGSAGAQVMLLGVLFMVGATPVFAAAAFAGARLGGWLRRSRWAGRALNRVAALVFVGLAAKLATTTRP